MSFSTISRPIGYARFAFLGQKSDKGRPFRQPLSLPLRSGRTSKVSGLSGLRQARLIVIVILILTHRNHPECPCKIVAGTCRKE